MTYIGIIFVPMIYFRIIKAFFDNWWKATVSFILQPVVITVVILVPFLCSTILYMMDVTLNKSEVKMEKNLIITNPQECKGSLAVNYKGFLILSFLSK